MELTLKLPIFTVDDYPCSEAVLTAGYPQKSMAEVDINLTARQETIGEPWIWRLSREFDVRVIIVKANIDADFGWMQIRLDGPVEEIQRATAWLMTTGLHVDALQRSVKA